MDPNFLMLLFFGGSQGRGAEVVKRTLPVTLLGSPLQRFWLAALVAAKELKRQDETVLTIVQDVVTQDKIKDADTLKRKFSKLYEVFTTLPAAVRDSIQFYSERVPDGVRGKS